MKGGEASLKAPARHVGAGCVNILPSYAGRGASRTPSRRSIIYHPLSLAQHHAAKAERGEFKRRGYDLHDLAAGHPCLPLTTTLLGDPFIQVTQLLDPEPTLRASPVKLCHPDLRLVQSRQAIPPDCAGEVRVADLHCTLWLSFSGHQLLSC